jgi:hypothetical protein
MIVNTPATNLAALADLVASTGALGWVKYHLYSNNLNPQPTNVIGDFTECTFPGYSPSATITWNTPFLDANLVGNVYGNEIQFNMSSDSITQTVYGYFVVGKQGADTVGITLIYAEQFAVPVALTYTGQSVPLVPAYQLG